MRYPISVQEVREETLVINCPLLPEVMVVCRDDEEADLVGPAREAILHAFATRIASREPIPLLRGEDEPFVVAQSGSRPRDIRVRVALPREPSLFVTFGALVALKVELHNAMVADGVRKAELGRRLGVHPPIVDRLLDLGHASKLEPLEAALAVLGREIEIGTRAA